MRHNCLAPSAVRKQPEVFCATSPSADDARLDFYRTVRRTRTARSAALGDGALSPSASPARPPRPAAGGGGPSERQLIGRGSSGTLLAGARRHGQDVRRAAVSPHGALPALRAACPKAAAGSWSAWPTAGPLRAGVTSYESPWRRAPPAPRSAAGAGSCARAVHWPQPAASRPAPGGLLISSERASMGRCCWSGSGGPQRAWCPKASSKSLMSAPGPYR